MTFLKNGAAIADVTSTLASAAATGTQPIEFRNIQITADGTRTIEIWETSAQSTINSVGLDFALPAGSVATWQNATTLPSDWSLLGNTDIPGEFMLAGMGLNRNADGIAVSPYQFLAADVNEDGRVKATDALKIS